VRAERSTFTVNSFIAIIALTGMVTNNAIVLIDCINTRRGGGMAAGESLRVAGRERLAPIILTTITTLVGFLPTAVGWPDFNVTWAPMATAFIAGLSMSTVLTLLVVPVLYQGLDRHRKAIAAVFAAVIVAATAILAYFSYR
jgi:HAE1 family hydrophobic/amphiphilic exporter-1